MRGNQRGELVDQACGLSQFECGPEAILTGAQAKLVQALGGEAEVAVVGMAGKRRTVPQSQRRGELLVCGAGIATGESLGSVADQALEAIDVDHLRIDVEKVAAAAATDRRVVTQDRPQSRDVRTQCRGGPVWRLACPELVNQVVGVDDPAAGKDQVGEERLLPPAAKPEETSIATRFDPAEEAQLERRGPVGSVVGAHAMHILRTGAKRPSPVRSQSPTSHTRGTAGHTRSSRLSYRQRGTMADAKRSLAPRELDQLRRACGEVITPDHAGYDDARRLWNAIHDRRPAVIVKPTTAEMVATAVRFARDKGLEIVVKSGGHSTAGLKGADGCFVVDLSEMRGVEVNPETRIARSNGGALLGELDVAAQAHGLVCPIGVVGHTGVAGLTLGGGVGRLQRNFGLTIDNVAAVELVTADGRLIRATETDEPELFWGLRGAGWNFGIATAFEFRLHPFGPDLHRGVVAFPASQIHDVWNVYRDYALDAPDAVAVIFGIDRAGPDAGYPDDLVGKPIVYLAWNHSGSADDAERDTAALRAGPTPVSTVIGSARYLDVQTAHDLQFAWGGRSFIKSHNANDIRPEALDELVELITTAPGAGSFSVTAYGGAISRVPEDATAYAGRASAFDLSTDADWSDPAQDEAMFDWCRRVLAVTEPDRALGAYANGNSDVGPEESRRIYGDAKLARLAALKREWDPDNIFHVNPNVAPGDA